MSVMVCRRGKIPVDGKILSDYAEGDIVLLNENGSPVEFYVAKQNYERSLNGAGRTLLVRKECHEKRQWHTSGVNAYATSAIDAWLNGDYKATLDAKVQSVIGTTKFYYTIGNKDNTVTTLERAVFMLSVTELYGGDSGAIVGGAPNAEGSTLPIANILAPLSQMTRTPYAQNNSYATYYAMQDNGIPNGGVYCNDSNLQPRPCFTLPASAYFDFDTNEFKGA